MDIQNYIDEYLKEISAIAQQINHEQILIALDILREIKKSGGRIFFLGVGGGAASASHAANDFNKIAKIATFCLTDNVGLLTALTNDEGWEMVFQRQLEMYHLNASDALFIYSVGGGSETTSKNLVLAINYAKEKKAKILGVVGKSTGATAQKADACIIVPMVNEKRITAHAEDFQLVIDHLLVNLLAEIEKENEK